MTSLATAKPGTHDTGRVPLTLVSLSAVTWDFRLVGRTRMLTEMWMRGGQPTVFVQVPSVRTALQRMRARFMRPAGVPIVRPWPTYPARFWLKLGMQRVERAVRGRAAALRRVLDKLVDWDRAVAAVISPVWTPWLDELPFRHVVYDCIDDLAVHVPAAALAPQYREWEDRLVDRIDGAIATAECLSAGLRSRRPTLPMALIRNGVDVEMFRDLAASTPRPADVPNRGRPVVGFVGALYDQWVDWALIREVAELLPEFDFAFVGPRDRRSSEAGARGLANIYLLGPRAYDQVPAYMAAFDICWVPFKQNTVGWASNPVKIYEYLALGKPVVTTPVADTELFGELVQVARTGVEAADRLRDAARMAPEAAEARVAFARENSWDARAREYISFFEGLGTSQR